ncbi:hypothetical protein ABE288_07820 [Bacillus salipaludis]
MPRDAPVTIATFPFKLIHVFSFISILVDRFAAMFDLANSL